MKNPQERRDASAKFQSDKALLDKQIVKLKPLVEGLRKDIGMGTPKNNAVSIDTREFSTLLARLWSSNLASSPDVAVSLYERYMMHRELARVALALAAEKARTGKYPPTLTVLSFRYLQPIPKDIFSGKELIYKPTGSGYVLYSIGMNLKDDGGSYDGEQDHDDLVVKVE